MCGICGKIAGKGLVEQALVQRMCEVMRHRGPDDQGIYLDKNVGIGMRRLSIIDLDTGRQPIFNEDHSVLIVSNGEIYNYKELREGLESRGHRFATRTDVEVVLHLYEDEGEKCLAQLRGMFAFAIWDSRRRKLFLARDRIGKKPLYYREGNGSLIFASEIKAILQDPEVSREIDFEAVDDYFTHGFVPSPRTIFQEIRKLPPAHYAVYENSNLRLKRYWSVTYAEPSTVRATEEYVERLRELLFESVRLRLMSDVPLGAFLSGGVDSSIVVGIMSQLMDRPVETFSIGFEDRSYNELRYARIAASSFKTSSHEFEVRYEHIPDILPRLVHHFDEPFADSSAIPTYYISEIARRYVTVALSGDAGDEIFAGYRRYLARRLASYYNRLPRSLRKSLVERTVKRLPEPATYYGHSLRKKVRLFVDYASQVEEEPHISWTPFFSPIEKEKLYSSELKSHLGERRSYLEEFFEQAGSEDEVSQMMWVDLMTYLPDDILTKVDRMSMAVSLEARNPLLDHRLVEFMASVPVSLKLKGFSSKYLLKRAVEDLLPTEIMQRKKQGFVVPLASWFRKELKEFTYQALLRDAGTDYLNKEYIKTIVNEHGSGRSDHSQQIFALLSFHLWNRLIRGL